MICDTKCNDDFYIIIVIFIEKHSMCDFCGDLYQTKMFS